MIVPLLFWLYLCVAKLFRFRIPRLPRQILGTIQLYISFAFMLGLLRESGWVSEWTLLRPGDFGLGLARFFVLNAGTFITLMLVICSFILSAYFFGSRILKVSLPSMPSINFGNDTSKSRRTSRRRERSSSRQEQKPEDILFMKKLPAPTLKPAPSEYYDDEEEDYDAVQVSNTEPVASSRPDFTRSSMTPPKIQMPNLKPAPSAPKAPSGSNAVEILDNIIASINSGSITAPEKKRNSTPRSRKMRRPLPAVTLPDELEAIPEPKPAPTSEHEGVFPPPPELFGPRPKLEVPQPSPKPSDKQGKLIVSTLKNFGVNVSVAHTVTGPSVTQYQLELAPGTKVSKIAGLDEEIAMELEVISVRIEAPIPGTHYVGVEVPNLERRLITLRSLIESPEFTGSTARLPLPLGVQIDGKIIIQGLEDMPHLIIAGNKGSGKSTFINSCILSMCSRRTPDELKMILIDPRHVDFALYDGLPHLLASPVSDSGTALKALSWACSEMDARTSEFARLKVRNLAGYNRKLPKNKRLPEIVIVIDEIADLTYSAGSEIESYIVRLAQKSGPAGIYMMIASQRPSQDVITSLMKANISSRAVFMLTSQGDSRNISGSTDPGRLTGKGDMLFMNGGSTRIARLQAPYISDDKVSEFVDYMSSNLEVQDMMNF